MAMLISVHWIADLAILGYFRKEFDPGFLGWKMLVKSRDIQPGYFDQRKIVAVTNGAEV